MSIAVVKNTETQKFLDRVAGLDQPDGDPRVKKIVRRLVGDLFATIEEFNVSEDEFWTALNFLAAGAPEFGLWAPGLGFEHFLDARMDKADAERGVEGGTPRTIEGPLYVAGAPISDYEARLDDGSEPGETLIFEGRVLDLKGAPVRDAIVDVWHANHMGNYSYFDKTQPDYNLRRRIRVDGNGRYKFRSVVPSGYAVPPQGSTKRLLDKLGRHGKRPAHIHFFVSAPDFRHLTTQINIDGDPYLHDDFAYATRDGLIPAIVHHPESAQGRTEGVKGPYASIHFDFALVPAHDTRQTILSSRTRVGA